MGTKWTKEQKEAIETRGCNLLVAAAAGSGKTAVLVERIIRMVTDEKNPTDIDKLLVVTFTNAAAAEMRERIAAAITKELEYNPTSLILQKQLTLLSRANITTMHSFCLDVIKNNFHTIDLDPAFRILDETEGILLKTEVIDAMFEDLYDKEDEGFLKLVEAYSGSKDDEKLKDIILDLFKFSMSGPWPEKWLNEKAEEFNINTVNDLDKSSWAKVIVENLEIELDSYIGIYEKCIELINENEDISAYLDIFEIERSFLLNVKDKLKEGISKISKVLKEFDFKRMPSIRKNNIKNEEVSNFVKKSRKDIKEQIDKYKEKFSDIELSVNGIKNSYEYMKKLSSLTLEFSDRFSKKKKEKNILDFNDLEHLCLKILIEKRDGDEIIPSKVALKFKEYFTEVLVDEYQDSNSVQEAIIDLVSRKYSDNPNVFMVGDIKQSIYRFRQAKPELFLEKYNSYSKEEGFKNRVIQLYKNFRSREEVIDGVNFIFKETMSTNVGDLEYTDNEALNLGASFEVPEDDMNVGGDVELHILDKNDISFYNEEENDDEDIDSINIEAKLIANRIDELIKKEEFKVVDKEKGGYRNLEYKDIVILLRATKNYSDIFVDELGLKGIPVYADTGSGYFESIEIRTIMSLLKVIDNPRQDVPIIATLRSPIVGFNSEDLADIRMINKEKYFYENILAIANDEEVVSEKLSVGCKKFINDLENWRSKSIYTPIDEFIWYLYMSTGYFGYVGAMPNGILRQANLKILFQRAKQYEETSFKGLFNFINFINKLRKSSGDLGTAKILGENENVVRIMSIHKSKGLEFPVVFLANAGKGFNLMDLNNTILYHEELGFGPEYIDLEKRIKYPTLAKEAIRKKIKFETLSEEMRTLYVAFTRAKEKLIVVGSVRDMNKTFNNWYTSASIDDKRISPAEVLKGKSYLDWIGMSMLHHEGGNVIREKINLVGSFKNKENENSKWKVNILEKEDINFKSEEKEEEEIAIDNIFIKEPSKNVREEIEERLNYKYPFSDVTTIKSNFSVSDLKKSNIENLEEYEGESLYKEKIVIKPNFMKEEKGLSSAEKGTAIHFVMQKIDFDKINTIKEIKEQLEEMYDNQMISKEEFESVNPFKIKEFFNSDLGKRLLKVYKNNGMIHRELPFFTEISVTEINENIDKSLENEKVRLQGVIDLFFEEDGEIVLVDYKTDFVKDNIEDEMEKKYRVQLNYYKDALEKITGKKVKESYLYLFYIEKSIKIETNS